VRGGRDILVRGGLFDVSSWGQKKTWTSVHLVCFTVCCLQSFGRWLALNFLCKMVFEIFLLLAPSWQWCISSLL